MKEDKNVVLLLEDDEKITIAFKALFEETCKDAELITTDKLDKYLEAFEQNKEFIKCLVIDLNNNSEDVKASILSTIEQIKKHYKTNRIPIFVHSGNLEYFTDLDEKGTIIKKQKNRHSVSEIVNSISLMLQSGFLNIFCVNGSLDQKIMNEIHSAFVSQFQHSEIEEIIRSINKEDLPQGINNVERIRNVFERIAIRSIYNSFLNNDSKEASITVNSIEHYFRRTNVGKYPFFTGDLFEDNEGNLYFVATPRCNIANRNFNQILLCSIKEISQDQMTAFSSAKIDNSKTGETKGWKQLRTSITDDVTNANIGERFRFLPPSPQFRGGYVDLKQTITVKEEDLLKFKLIISLVDDLTNDVIRKLASYLLRGGISDTDYGEAMFYLIKSDVKSKIAIATEAHK